MRIGPVAVSSRLCTDAQYVSRCYSRLVFVPHQCPHGIMRTIEELWKVRRGGLLNADTQKMSVPLIRRRQSSARISAAWGRHAASGHERWSAGMCRLACAPRSESRTARILMTRAGE